MIVNADENTKGQGSTILSVGDTPWYSQFGRQLDGQLKITRF